MYVATLRFRFTPVSPDDWQRLDDLFRASVKYGSRNHYTPAQLDAWVRRVTPERWSELLTGDLFFFLAEAVDTGEAAGTAAAMAARHKTGVRDIEIRELQASLDAHGLFDFTKSRQK